MADGALGFGEAGARNARAAPRAAALCCPSKISGMQIEGRLETPDVAVEVRQYRWDSRVEGGLAANDEYSHLVLSLSHRIASCQVAFAKPGATLSFNAPGEIMFVPAGRALHARSVPMTERVVCCFFDRAKAAPILQADWSDSDLAAGLDIRRPAMRGGLLGLAGEAMAPGFASNILVEAITTSLIVELARHFQESKTPQADRNGGLAPWQMRAIHARVEAERDGSLTLSDLAADCRVSVRHLTRAFRKSTGATLGQYIAEARIGRAKRMLGGHDSMIKEIAFACGFQSQPAFAAAFRRATGITPSQYRQAAISGV